MPLSPGQELQLTIEKPAAGGRMIARHDGQVVLVLGAIPGERVAARVERVERSLAFAETARILEASPDRRDAAMDPRCGGCLYAHVAYPRQIALKADVIADAFARIGRVPLPSRVAVAGSPERGYRMRARLHVRDGRPGFYREGTHELCDAGQTGQLTDATVAAARAAAQALASTHVRTVSIEISENLAADERALFVELSDAGAVQDAAAAAAAVAGITGCSARSLDGAAAAAGVPAVADPLSVLTSGRAATGVLQRRSESFFQANRFLLPSLVTAVLDEVPPEGEVLDIYAGVGLFSVSLAGAGRRGIVAVEGDRIGGADLMLNAAQFAGAMAVSLKSVEDYLASRRGKPAETIVMDPPRTGLSKAAMQAVARHGARRVIYISCDPPTMARDARRLLDAGYRLTSLRGFDLFPNTPHVETLGVFESK